MDVKMQNNADGIKSAMKSAVEKALTTCAIAAEGYAKDLCPVRTGTLRRSITHIVQDNTAHVGTNVEYAPYVEFGTGSQNIGGGTIGSWVYQDSEGKTHRAHGQRPQPFLKPAVADHLDQYRQIIADALSE